MILRFLDWVSREVKCGIIPYEKNRTECDWWQI